MYYFIIIPMDFGSLLTISLSSYFPPIEYVAWAKRGCSVLSVGVISLRLHKTVSHW